jgi:hypothetical protein
LEQAKAYANRELQDAWRCQEREEDRRGAADHARRLARMDSGFPDWTDEESDGGQGG